MTRDPGWEAGSRLSSGRTRRNSRSLRLPAVYRRASHFAQRWIGCAADARSEHAMPDRAGPGSSRGSTQTAAMACGEIRTLAYFPDFKCRARVLTDKQGLRRLRRNARVADQPLREPGVRTPPVIDQRGIPTVMTLKNGSPTPPVRTTALRRSPRHDFATTVRLVVASWLTCWPGAVNIRLCRRLGLPLQEPPSRS